MPRGVDLRAEGGVDHHPPVAQLVAEPLHHDRAVVRHMPAGTALLVQIPDDVLGGPGVQTGGQQPQAGVLGPQRADLAQERAQGTAKLQGRPSWSPFQKGSRPGTPGAGETRTRSRVMSSIRQEVVPRVNTSPTRDS
ncbi:hypothetical protein SSPO_032430 [Streptomyces antimycoticus]|uniref:Uncharacterized protein n=1 Tax=Streptomyces antimycoticus TaxID=68175 RepID=A0A499UFY5_9ACTN|nr:hypothetical protein SSPO_032430 [Streptomyces antimycoticus]